MEVLKHIKTVTELKRSSSILLFSNAFLVIVVLILIIQITSSHDRIVMTPYIMDSTLEVSYESANHNYHKATALNISGFLGNINPHNASFAKEGVALLFSPELYTAVQQEIQREAETMKLRGKSLVFYPDDVIYEDATGKTFVTGRQEIISSSGAKEEQQYVYEYKIKIVRGVPQVIDYNRYTGAPRTLYWLQRNQGSS